MTPTDTHTRIAAWMRRNVICLWPPMRGTVAWVVLVSWGCVAEAPLVAAPPPEQSEAPARAVAPAERPAISGGSLLVTADGSRAVLGDPDTDRVLVIDLGTNEVVSSIELDYGAEPGRIVEDGAGRVHVALRRAGTVLTLDLASGEHRERSVCASPRGIAWRASDDTLLVACAEGVLVTLPAASGGALDRVEVDDDLRDVVIVNDQVLVSRFRAAEVLALDASGAVVHRWRPAIHVSAPRVPDRGTVLSDVPSEPVLEPQVAWRLVAAGDAVWLLHQYARVTPVALARTSPDVTPPAGEYGADVGGSRDPFEGMLVRSAISRVDLARPDGELAPATMLSMSLANDLAVSGDGRMMAISSPAEGGGPSVLLSSSTLCSECEPFTVADPTLDVSRASSIAFVSSALLVAVEHAPLAFVRWTTAYRRTIRVPLDRGDTPVSPGASLFYTVAPSGLACASCHPEGGDDGHVWLLGDVHVRTQSLRGHVLGTAPFHWEGDLASFDALIDEVWTRRMGGAELDAGQRASLAGWVGSLDALPAAHADPDAIARGAALFESAEVGCASCHTGAMRSSNQTMDVGTGGSWQVPQLVGVSYRAPLMHDGCATSLRDRLLGDASCTGGDRHGHTSQLSPDQIDDLVAYLRSL